MAMGIFTHNTQEYHVSLPITSRILNHLYWRHNKMQNNAVQLVPNQSDINHALISRVVAGTATGECARRTYDKRRFRAAVGSAVCE